MANGARVSIEAQTTDMVVGAIMDAGLNCRVSVRGGRVVVLAFAKEERGIEVAFTPKSARMIAELVEAAAKTAEGGG